MEETTSGRGNIKINKVRMSKKKTDEWNILNGHILFLQVKIFICLLLHKKNIKSANEFKAVISCTLHLVYFLLYKQNTTMKQVNFLNEKFL